MTRDAGNIEPTLGERLVLTVIQQYPSHLFDNRYNQSTHLIHCSQRLTP